jgi:SAM-dependent methyltransferase
MTNEQANTQAARDKMVGFWNGHAVAYDAAPGGGITAETEHAAWLDVLRRLLPSSPSDVLDVGTGPGVMAMLAAELGHQVIGIDLAEQMLTVARAKPGPTTLPIAPRFERGDAADPPFAPASFDVVLSRYVLWTMVDPAWTLSNWLLLLRPGGRRDPGDGAAGDPRLGRPPARRSRTDDDADGRRGGLPERIRRPAALVPPEHQLGCQYRALLLPLLRREPRAGPAARTASPSSQVAAGPRTAEDRARRRSALA